MVSPTLGFGSRSSVGTLLSRRRAKRPSAAPIGSPTTQGSRSSAWTRLAPADRRGSARCRRHREPRDAGGIGSPAHPPSVTRDTRERHIDFRPSTTRGNSSTSVQSRPSTATPSSDRSSRPASDSHLPRIEADMCIGGEYRLALIPLWHNGFPGCDVSCCPVRRSAARRGGTTSAASRVVRASTTPSTVTPLVAGTGLALRSSASPQVPRCRSASSKRCSVAPCPRRQVPHWGRRGARTRSRGMT